VPGRTQWWLLGYGPGVAQPDPDHMLLCIHHHSSSAAAAAAMPADAWGPGFSSHGLGPSSDPGGWLVSGAHQGLKQLHHNLELASHSPAAPYTMREITRFSHAPPVTTSRHPVAPGFTVSVGWCVSMCSVMCWLN